MSVLGDPSIVFILVVFCLPTVVLTLGITATEKSVDFLRRRAGIRYTGLDDSYIPEPAIGSILSAIAWSFIGVSAFALIVYGILFVTA